uniref:G_PROTEIN_RECEP_F1_2 domain-containing protein n=1 Tax=Strongyloides venezuelensis TaxID=75913 RepID=A0A0K0FW04_STRVS
MNSNSERNEEGVPSLQDKIFDKYQLLAYIIVLSTYLICFCEYLYLRLTSLLIPEHFKWHQKVCHKNEAVIGKNAWHYSIAILIFIVVAIFKVLCFFLLTLSDPFFKKEPIINLRQKLTPKQKEFLNLKLLVLKLANDTMYPTFGIYIICSVIILLISYYLLVINDSLDLNVSRVLTFVFDGLMIIYLLSFPIITIIYHPDFYCWSKENQTRNTNDNKSSILLSHVQINNSTRLRRNKSQESISQLNIPSSSAFNSIEMSTTRRFSLERKNQKILKSISTDV